MKIAIITDTHFGVRNDNISFLDNSKKFFDNVFFPYIKENGINDVLHLGDLVDRRKYININTANRMREDFLEPLSNNCRVHMVAGNHDTYYKNTNSVNALQELVAQSYPFFIYDKYPEIVQFENLPILLIPWICDENRKESMQKIKTCPTTIAAGHLEIQGFEMYRGSIVSHGDDRSIFDRFDMVLSGHYHHRSNDGTIFYLGSHAEFTWSDYDDPRGFHVLDTETRELTFVQNPFVLFKKVFYNDSKENFDKADINFDQYQNCMIKVIVQEKNDLFKFDKFIEQIENSNPIDLQIVEDHLNLNLEDDNDIINEAESTIDIFKKYIETLEDKTLNKEKLESMIVQLHNEALAVE